MRTHENIVSLTKTFDLEGCLAVKILSQVKLETLRVTGEVAKARTIIYLRKLKLECERLKFDVCMMKIYVDDVLPIVKFPGRGLLIEKEDFVWNQEQEQKDLGLPEDVITAELLVQIANNLDGERDIQMTYDTPSLNESGMMPVLDLQVWCEDGEMFFRFFEKPVSSQFVIRRDSALPWNTKKISMAGEVCRRYLNTSPSLVEKGEVGEIIDKFRHKLMVSGYTMKEREIIVSEGVARYVNIVKQAQSGSRPLYRTSQWQREHRAIKRLIKNKTWSKSDSVIFVQATPGELLKKEVKKIVDNAGFKVRVVEKGGRSMKRVLQRSDVCPPKLCLSDVCPICATEGKGKCDIEGVVYRIWCTVCEEEGIDASMYGETGRTGKLRCSEHMKDLVDPKKSSNLREHCQQFHQGVFVQFGCAVVKTFPGDPLSRQLKEAILIDSHAGPSMNDKGEWVRPASIRIRAERS